MKKISKLLYALVALSFVAVACSDDDEFEPGPQDAPNTFGVYFPTQAASGSHTYDPEMERKIDFTVARSNASGAATVPFTVKASEEGIFNCGTISFADGQTETTLEVTFDAAKVGTTYNLSITLDDDDAYIAHYDKGAISIDFSVLIVTWVDFLNPETKEPAVITLYEEWWGEVHTATLRYYEVDGIRTCVATSNEDGNGIWGDSYGATLEFTWYTKDNNDAGYNFLEVKKQYFGFDYNDWVSKPEGSATYPIYVYDYPWYWIERGYNWGDGMGDDWLDEAKTTGQIDGSYPVSYYDGNGGFHFNLRYYIPGLGGFSPPAYDVLGIAEGFTRVDYSLSVEQTGVSVEGEVPVAFKLGPDVAEVDYVFAEGTLSNIQVENAAAEIKAGAEDAITESGTYGFDLGETGTYTLVAVAFDKDGKAQTVASAPITYLASGDEEEYAVVVSGGVGSAAKYIPQGISTDTAIEFWVYGEDLVDLKVGAVKYIDLVSDYDACIEAITEAESVNAKALALANGDGYVDVFTGLLPGTEYYMLVYANNGYSETVEIYGPETTTGDPLPIYQTFTAGDYNPDYEIEDRSGWLGTWNLYGVDWYGGTGLREYLGKSVIEESPTPTEGPDEDGFYDEYTLVSGLFGDLSWLADYGIEVPDDRFEMDVYAGAMYTCSDYLANESEEDYEVYLFSKGQDKPGWQYCSYYFSAFIPVLDGYYAFVDGAYGTSYNFGGLGLYLNGAGWVSNILDHLLVDPEKDDNGLAPDKLQKAINRAKMNMEKSVQKIEGTGLKGKKAIRAAIAEYMKEYNKTVSFSTRTAGVKGDACPATIVSAKSVKYVGPVSHENSRTIEKAAPRRK